ncbi:phosphoglycolate phosphatase [soil metagenome]
MQTKVNTILFDLDGTLLDTAPDLAFALNQLRQNYSLAPLAYEKIKPWVSHGAAALLKVGMNIEKADASYGEICQQFLKIYSEHLAQATQIYPGILSVLSHLQYLGIRWGIVTNKPAWLTDPLVNHFEFTYPPACIVSGDTVTKAKPHPDPLLHACKLMECEIQTCIYIGDAERDIQAAKQASMRSLVAAYGYIGEGENPLLWGANGILNTPMDLILWLKVS